MPGMDQGKIGTFIMECRKSRGLTQAQLAEKLNITDRAVSKWENGKSLPDSSIMLELCALLGITADELLRGARSPEPEAAPPPDIWGGMSVLFLLLAAAFAWKRRDPRA